MSKFRQFLVFTVREISIPPSLAMTTFHTSTGATQTATDLSHFLNPPVVAPNQDSGTQLT